MNIKKKICALAVVTVATVTTVASAGPASAGPGCQPGQSCSGDSQADITRLIGQCVGNGGIALEIGTGIRCDYIEDPFE